MHVALASGSRGNDRIRSDERSSAHNHAQSDGRRSRGTAAALAMSVGMAPTHPKSPPIKNEWVDCPRQLSSARCGVQSNNCNTLWLLDAGSSNEEPCRQTSLGAPFSEPRFSGVNRKKIRSPIGGLVQFSFHAGLRKSKSSAQPPSRPTSPHCRRRGDLTSAEK